MKRIVLCACFFSTVLFAKESQLKLEVNLVVNGQPAKAEIVTSYGKSSMISRPQKDGETLEIQVLPKHVLGKDSKPAVDVEICISQLKAGKRSSVADAKIITKLGQEASISEMKAESHTLEIRVLPTEIAAK